jgi:glycosyltransferase involved in cell wall biosynthesis
MRVAIVERRTIHKEGESSAKRLHTVAELLAMKGHAVSFYCLRWWEEEDREKIHNGVRYYAISEDIEDVEWRFAAQLPSKIKEYEPDVIIADGTERAVVMGSKFTCLFLRKPLILDFYKQIKIGRGSKRKSELIMGLADLVVVPSEMVQTSVIEAGCEGKLIERLPNPIEIKSIKDTKKEKVADIVYSKVLDKNCNLETFLLALAELRDVKWKAAIIGEGERRELYERQIKDLRISRRVEFLGEVPTERKIAIFKGAHVCVHTALQSGFPKDFLLALACGCVGIAEYHENSSAHELIRPRERGFRITEGEVLHQTIREAAKLPRKEIEEGYFGYSEKNFIEKYIGLIENAGGVKAGELVRDQSDMGVL